MKSTLKAVSWFLALSMTGAEGVSELFPQERLTLSEAIARAMESNPDLAIDLPAREAARSQLDASRAGYRPRFDLEQSYTGGNNPVYVFGTLLSQRRFTAANFSLNSLNRPEPVDNLQTRLMARQTLWDGGRTRHRVEAARLGVDVADRTHEDNTRRTLLSVLEAYYSVSLARENLAAARAAVDSAQAIAEQAQARVQRGVAVEADLLRGQVFLGSARQDEIEAQGDLQIAVAVLNRLMGMAHDAAQGETATLDPGSQSLPDERVLRDEQRKNRPDYQRLLTEVQMAESEVRSRKAEFFPVLGAFASWEADNPSIQRAGGNNWTAGLSLRWNLYAGSEDLALLDGSRHRLEQKRRELAALESAMVLEVHRTLIETRSSQKQMEVAVAAEAQSRESLRMLKNRYDAGLATITDLLSAEAARASARSALAAAVFRYRLNFARVEFVSGTLSPTSAAMKP